MVAAAWMRANNLKLGPEPLVRFVTGRLEIDYLRPTPLGGELEVRSRVVELGQRKAIVDSDLYAGDDVCAHGHVVAIKMPEDLLKRSHSS